MSSEALDALVFLGLISFISNIAPGSLEVVLTVFIHKHTDLAILGWLTATIFNALGSTLIFLLGNKLPNKKEFSPRTKYLIQKYGSFSLLFSGVPLIGDVLPLAAGWFRLKILPSIICLFIGKAVRYGLIVLFLEYVMHKIAN